MRAWLATRDGVIVVVALALAVYEVGFGGARPAVLTFLSGLLLSPLVMKIDSAIEARRRDQAKDEP